MIRSRSSIPCGLFMCVVFCAGAAAGVRDDDFKPLFNGKDLTGWVTPDDKSIFTVVDGEIIGKTKKDQLKKNEFLVSDKDYGDFILKVKVKVLSGNSGVQVRSKRAADGAVSGPQADAAAGYWGLLYEERGRGILERYPEDKAKKLIRDNDWNDFEIKVQGDHLVITLNGTKVIDRTDPKFDKRGIIALQVHAGPPMEVHFKDVQIKTLD